MGLNCHGSVPTHRLTDYQSVDSCCFSWVWAILGVRRMCRTLRAGMRQYGLFRYFDKVLPCGLGCG